MNDLIEKANFIIVSAEVEYRELIAQAAKLGDYRAIEILTEKALALREMVSSERNPNSPRPLPRPKVALQKPNIRNKNGKKSKYPRFAKAGDHLIKIAWSKAKKGEYRHKAPKHVLSRLAETLDEKIVDGRIVSMDDVMPLFGKDSTEFPEYQIYLALAWFRALEVIQQNGREGYSRAPGISSIAEIVLAAWSNLPGDKK